MPARFMGHLSLARAVVDPGWRSFCEMTSAMLFGAGGLLGPDGDETTLAARFERHVDEVRAAVPRDRLLVWAPEESWEPLCDFVGAARPAGPFPYVNDSEMFEERVVESSLATLNQYWAARNGRCDDVAVMDGVRAS